MHLDLRRIVQWATAVRDLAEHVTRLGVDVANESFSLPDERIRRGAGLGRSKSFDEVGLGSPLERSWRRRSLNGGKLSKLWIELGNTRRWPERLQEPRSIRV